jgi:hypothetical protein
MFDLGGPKEDGTTNADWGQKPNLHPIANRSRTSVEAGGNLRSGHQIVAGYGSIDGHARHWRGAMRGCHERSPEGGTGRVGRGLGARAAALAWSHVMAP